MYRFIFPISLLLAQALSATCFADSFGSGSDQFAIEFVTIGDPNNLDDTTGGSKPSTAGRVEYTYRMGKFEISEDIINKVNALSGLGISLINRSAEKPATGFNWFEAAMLINWLNTSQGHHEAYNFDGDGNFQLWSSTEAWQLGGENLYRHRNAFYFMPNLDEWYKAAYYDASIDTYFDFPNGSDSPPVAVASGTAANSAVYSQNFFQGPADVTLAGGPSPFGTIGQGGNAWEWTESEFDFINDLNPPNSRWVRGGFWESDSVSLLPSRGVLVPANNKHNIIGLRVASIPEPDSCILALFTLCWTFRRTGLLFSRRE